MSVIEKVKAYKVEILSVLFSLVFIGILSSSWEKDVGILLFTMRDYFRASQILEGRFLWYGPELNLGGYLPGSFFYFLQAGVLLFKRNILAVVFLCYFLHGLAVFFLSYWLGKRINLFASLIAILLIYSSPVINTNLFRIWNPSFLILFAVLPMILFFEGFRQRKSWIIYLGCIFVSLGGQIHFTSFYGLIFLLLLTRGKIAEELVFKINKKEVLGIFISLILPLTPFLIWLFSKETTAGAGLFWESQIKNIQLNNTIAEGRNLFKDIKPFLNWLWIINPLFLLIVRKIVQKDFSFRNLSPLSKSLLILTLILFFINFLPFHNKFRYILIFQIFYISLTAVLAGELVKYKKTFGFYALMIILALFFQDKSIPKRPKGKLVVEVVRNFNEPQNLNKTLQILDYIYEETGWSPEEFEDKALQLVAGMFEYSSVYYDRFKYSDHKSTNKYDGVMILPNIEKLKDKPGHLLYKIGVSRNINYFFKDQKFYKKPKKIFDDIVVVFYKMMNKRPVDVPHNLGNIYQKRPIEKFVDSLEFDEDEIRLVSFEGKKLIVWNISKGNARKRRLIFHFETNNDGKNILILNSHILRLSNNYVDNFFDELFIYNLKVNLATNDKKIEIPFPPFLGHSKVEAWAPEYIMEDMGLNKYLVSAVTPIKRLVPSICDKGELNFEIHAEYISVSRFRSSFLESEASNIKKSLVLDPLNLSLCHPDN